MNTDLMLYVVIGYTGEYGDKLNWMVKAFFSLDAATQHATNATRRANELCTNRPSIYQTPKEVNEYDPDMYMSYTGTRYEVESVPLDTQQVSIL